jgi:predicted nucleic acid-binding protein
MPERKPRIYWDACVFLSFINGLPDRLPEIETLLLEAEKETIELLTSTLSIVEVAFAATEQSQHMLDEGAKEKIDKLWFPSSSPVKLVEFHRLIAEDARDLMRKALAKGWSLKPLDAVHLSSAQRMAVDEFHTYDNKLYKYHELVGCRIQQPFVAQPGIFLP